jgi:hypothetical protein
MSADAKTPEQARVQLWLCNLHLQFSRLLRTQWMLFWGSWLLVCTSHVLTVRGTPNQVM